MMKRIAVSMLALFAGIAIMAQDLPKATTKGAVRLFGDKDDLTSVLTLIPDDSTVEVVTADSLYTRILFDGLDGFVRSDRLGEPLPEAAPVTVQMMPPADRPADQQPVQQPQPQYQQEPPLPEEEQYYAPANRWEALVDKYGADIGKRLYQHKVWKGITSDMARDSWGKPVQINRMYVDQSVEEEWIYSKKYLYFRDGILVDWGPVK
ncbi:MAG: hypothetical protein P1P83_01985 [Bacteroidales bacterium]|nr:hypothetical protein [Bacteroidales bacterium]MDT8373082.1 hypothetical protein [Bacteroidales bacterium]